MKSIKTSIPSVDFFYHITPAPPKEVNRLELIMNKEEFIIEDTKSNQKAIAKRIDFFSIFIDGREPIPKHITAFALNEWDTDKAVEILRKRFPGHVEIACFLFHILEVLPEEEL